jgi:transketolase
MSNRDRLTILATGITVHEALKAYQRLSDEGIKVRVVDLYSIQPIDEEMLEYQSYQTKLFLVVEDHYQQGGVAEAVQSSLGKFAGKVHSLCVRKMPRSGQPAELLQYEEIDAEAIVRKVKEMI